MTRICPSQPSPLPIPMVGTGIARKAFQPPERDELEHDAKDTGQRQRLGVLQQLIGLLVRLAFDPITALFLDPLGEHPEMPQNWNFLVENCPNERKRLDASFDFYRFGSGLDQTSCAGHGSCDIGSRIGAEVGH